MTKPERRFSFAANAHNIGDEDYFLGFIEKLRPTAITIMHGRGLCDKVLQRSPETVVYYRDDVDQDPDLLKMDPGQYVYGGVDHKGNPKKGIIERFKLNKQVRGYILNEPNPAMGHPWSHIVWWLASVGYALAEAGIPAVIGNLPVGAYQEADVEAGTFDPLLRMLVETKPILASKGAAPHTLGVHEHTAILDPYGVGQWPHTHLLDKTKVQRENWPTPEQIPFKKWEMLDDNTGEPVLDRQGKPILRMPPYWHILRFSWLLLRAIDIGLIQKPEEITVEVTEFGPDAMGDVESKKPNVYDILAKKYGIPAPHISIRCYNTLRPIYLDYFPKWTFEQTVFEQWKWLLEIYYACVNSIQAFTWSFGKKDWDLWYGCNVSVYTEAHQRMLEYLDTDLPDEEPEPPAETPNPLPGDPRRVRMQGVTANGANVRERPVINATNVLTTIQAPGQQLWIIPHNRLTPAEQALADQGGTRWHFVELDNGIAGWSRSDVLKIEALPPDNPEPDPILQQFVNLTLRWQTEDIETLSRRRQELQELAKIYLLT